MHEDEGLKLWKAWFAHSGNPYVLLDNDRWDEQCFFCDCDKPNHNADCIYVQAKALIDKENALKAKTDL